jgi:hypothetical protein
VHLNVDAAVPAPALLGIVHVHDQLPAVGCAGDGNVAAVPLGYLTFSEQAGPAPTLMMMVTFEPSFAGSGETETPIPSPHLIGATVATGTVGVGTGCAVSSGAVGVGTLEGVGMGVGSDVAGAAIEGN